MTTTPRHSAGLIEMQRRGRFGATCPHGSAEWEGARPQCEQRTCLRRWWWRFGLWYLLLPVAVVVAALLLYRTPDCPPGWAFQGLGICTRP